MELYRYQLDNGREPFSEWLSGLTDKIAQARIRVRLRQLAADNFGDVSAVGEGVLELRVHVGAGYRVYFGRHGTTAILLLLGGSKKGQARDIKLAKRYWSEWKEKQP